MKPHILRALAAMLAAGTVSFALAQTDRGSNGPERNGNAAPGTTLSDANVPTTRSDVNAAAAKGDTRTGPMAGRAAPAPAVPFVSEPVASSSKSGGPDGELVDGIVKALNADPSMRESKIAVQAENGKVIMSGSTMTRAQVKRAYEIAIAKAGEGKVVNAIADSQT